MKTESKPEAFEIIEIIDDDAAAFSDRAPTRTVYGVGRRWVEPVAGAALVAVIAYGVVSSAISSDTPSKATKASVPTTAAALSPRVPGTTPVAAVSPVYYVADPVPSGFAMHFADTLAPDAANGPAELWATKGATATTGSWFVVSIGTHHSTQLNSYRTLVDGTEVTVERDPPSGQSRLSFNKAGNAMEVTAFGWADRQLMRLVASAYVDGSRISYHDAFFTSDHSLLLAADPFALLDGRLATRVAYSAALPAYASQSFTVTDGGYSDDGRDVATRFALTDVSSIKVGHVDGIIGQSAADPTVGVVQWRDGDRLITLRGNLDRALLSSIAQAVRPGTGKSVRRQATVGVESILPSPVGQRHTVATGPPDLPWTVEEAHNVFAGAPSFFWLVGPPRESAAPSSTRLIPASLAPGIETLVVDGKTYVLANVPRSMAGATLHVDRNGLASVKLDMVDVDPDLGDLLAGYSFTEPLPFTVQIVDADGHAVASWPLT